jgi:acetyl esterase/lipase
LTNPDIPALRKILYDRKKAMTASQQSDPSATAGITEEDLTIPARDGFQIPIRVYKPESPPAGGCPLVVFIHGGGFVLGGLEGEELNCRLFVQKLGCVCVNVDYRLAPEHPFPASVQDGWDAVKWAAANASKIGADPTKGFIVGGTSAGGNIAAVAGHLARDEKLSPPVTGLALLIPALTDHYLNNIDEKYAKEIVSYEQNRDAPVLPLKSMDLFIGELKAYYNFSFTALIPMNRQLQARPSIASLQSLRTTNQLLQPTSNDVPNLRHGSSQRRGNDLRKIASRGVQLQDKKIHVPRPTSRFLELLPPG